MRARPPRLKLRYRRRTERGVAALELALVFPIFVVMMGGIFTFSLTYLSRQLMSNLASEVARACVLRSYNGQNAIISCVQPMGQRLAARTPGLCYGAAVSFVPSIVNPGVQGFNEGSDGDYIQESLLKVNVSCHWPMGAGMANLYNKPLMTPGLVQAVSTEPYTIVDGADR